MLESDHEVEEEGGSSTTTQEVDQVADQLNEKVVIDPLEGEEPATEGEAIKPTIKERAKKVAADVQAGAKKTYAKVKEKTQEYRKELGERTAKVVEATREGTLDAVGAVLTYATNSKAYLKNALSKEALQKMRENAMKKYPEYFTGEADRNRKAFQDFLAQGAEPVHVEHGKQTQVPFRVKNGDVVRWNFRVLKDDIEFSVNIRTMQVGGAVEENVRQPQRFKAGENYQGSYNFVYAAGQVVLTWSNAYSWFKGKHVAYIAEVLSTEEAAQLQTTGLTTADSGEASATPDEADAGSGEAPAVSDSDSAPGAGAEVPPVVMQESTDGADSSQQLPAVAAQVTD